MTKSGNKNFLSIAQGVDELNNNKSIVQLLSTSESFIDKLKSYRDELTKEVELGITEGKKGSDKLLEVNVDYYQFQTLKHEKSLNKSIKNLSARIDKAIDWELDDVYQYQHINDDISLVTRAIIMDFLYQGKFEDAEKLYDGTGDGKDMSSFNMLLEHFKTLRAMMQSVYDEDYSIVFEWISRNNDIVNKVSEIKPLLNKLIYYQTLEIKSHRCEIPKNGNMLLDIQNNIDSKLLLKIKDYHLSRKDDNEVFSNELPTLDNAFDKDSTKDEVVKELIKVYNKFQPELVNLQKESPLKKCLLAGHFALGALLKYATLSRRRSSAGKQDRRRSSTLASSNALLDGIRMLNPEYDDESVVNEGSFDGNSNSISTSSDNVLGSGPINELPMEVELPSWMGYHTIFICPILREETTDLDRPNILPCRHFISEQALSKLAKGLSDDLKCPYCPSRSSWREACEVKFIAL